jgi:hypothetical protein
MMETAPIVGTFRLALITIGNVLDFSARSCVSGR